MLKLRNENVAQEIQLYYNTNEI